MDVKCLLVLTLVLVVASAQKLFFKSNRLIQEELRHHEQDKTKEVNGFGFKEPKKYFTGPRKIQETAPKDKTKEVNGFGFKEPKKYFTGPRKIQETAPKVSADAVVCPGNKSACPPGNTCCMTATMAYGCCPLPLAVCCLDRRHCCPSRTRCDLGKQACISGEMIVPWYEKTAAISLETTDEKEKSLLNIESVICPDGKHMCEDGQTCCKSAEEYSCCPLPNAVCCSDEVHCCPTGTTCDVSHSRCVKQETGEFFNWMEKKSTKKIQQQQHDSDRLRMISTAVLSPETGSVRCDDKHVCPTGNTCCRMQDNKWGCCPKPEAECCDDHTHCCPKGSVCNIKSSSCVNGNEIYEWSLKQPATILEAVKCDDRHECPSGNTCCKLKSGQWGCCPLPKAVCCSDGVHCCPSGKTCDVASGKCNGGDTQLDWFVKVPAKEVGEVHCDATHVCPSRNTCCKLKSGQWGCCPLPEAVCCSDDVHCCPAGNTCDVASGKCNGGDTQLDWFVKLPAKEVGEVKCDSTHYCPSGNTCCKLSSDKWGCCPIPKAVCCSDHVHCCPEGTTCSVSTGKCNRGETQLDWFVKVPAKEVGSVRCDATHECKVGNTCCRTSSGQWGCCPLPHAVCCSDHAHCCPDGTTCEVSTGKCNRGETQLDWFVKVPAKEVGSVKCDATHECKVGNTCCRTSSGQWGCCPLPHAVCCSDHAHCCPDGTTCEVSTGKCNRGETQLDWFVKVPAKEVGSVKCDATHECKVGNTCCRTSSGQWGCCPLPHAVCCSDHAHCCPDGTTCEVSTGKCNRGETQLDWFVKVPAKEVGSVKCDATHECKVGNTCCRTSSGQWGCCPLPHAVCCSDHAHCCPDGTTCEVSTGKCNRGETQLDWFVKVPAKEVGSVKCDATHECKVGNTCCRTSSGQWGCCPLPHAVCCSDHAHCCPDGTTCEVSTGKCNRGETQLDWFVKVPAKEVGSVKCDATHECNVGNTCCRTSSGQWGCCPLPHAVCCSDHAHCCPDGTTCEVSTGKCNRGETQLDWFVKVPAKEVGSVKCDATHECKVGNTCCRTSSGQWGCCPLPHAVCCSDHAHCCPDGTTCEVSTGKCNRGETQLDWFVKVPAKEVGSVKCDATHECKVGNTCCRTSSGQWGCCPLPHAVCCSDGVHCCPHGTTCDVSSGKCNRGNTQLDWFVKVPANAVGNVKCDGEHECPSGNTCCKLSSGQWGCCPLPKAVCCSDGVHCCPDGTTCDVSSGKCNRGDTQLDWFVKVPANKVGNVKCDSVHECPSGNTCCKLSSGQWGCCPLPKAVCYSDGVHCCPHGTTCDVSSGKCNRGDTQLDWFVKVPANKVGSVKCDSDHECPSGNTCCKLSSGQWGCCPLPKAVCCSDGVHCCPDGTSCDVSSGKCNRGDTQLDWFVKVPANKVGNVKCDSVHECPSGNTCCKLSSGQWGCCPLPKAVCCSDGVHCCPDGTTCDVSSGKCNRGDTQLNWFVKVPAIKVGNVKCDSDHECPSGNTCCKLSSGQWGCCPLPKAVCCSDGVHCCPDGTTCDVSSGKCNRGDTQLDWFVKVPANKVENVKCDSVHECPSGNTCCKLSSGQWGCCPLPKAVCCSDGVHCCPDGTTCDVSSGKCNRGDTQLDWFVKVPANEVGNVKCDSVYECPSGNTCCKLSSGQWGCCPLPKAVCCSDGVHCCPDGTTCDVSSGKCNRGDTQLDWFVKVPANKVGNVKCDSVHECPSGNTCCKLSSGQWGCCPLPKAVCCSDGVHCCPSGTKCDVSTGKCNRGDIQLDWFLKMPAILKLKDVICPDGSECQTGQTCCEMNNGVNSYGCCPLPNAVCCNDGQHCCPQGYKCNLGAGVCFKGYMKLPLIRTAKRNDYAVNIESGTNKNNDIIAQNANSIKDVKDTMTEIQETDVQCPDKKQCPAQYSCCDNGQGGYNCCPMPTGVCCSDHQHCCPHGYICDEEPGICRIPETKTAVSNFIRKFGTKRGIPLV